MRQDLDHEKVHGNGYDGRRESKGARCALPRFVDRPRSGYLSHLPKSTKYHPGNPHTRSLLVNHVISPIVGTLPVIIISYLATLIYIPAISQFQEPSFSRA